ncbi:restriction endonuclease [Acidithiobacillus sulfuriphilus]|uniref:Restriction endonuclease n=2 Tax=Acidithiobacillus sulfuriphilus TaxID=1867749 RepID=A0A3M8QNP4_9PROT|nr:restriction endonuclease [Acidithiobacillus sulfuriphilus]RNF57768.1 restriction endonuclease [Acidithiobacillus sulfuriphilus]
MTTNRKRRKPKTEPLSFLGVLLFLLVVFLLTKSRSFLSLVVIFVIMIISLFIARWYWRCRQKSQIRAALLTAGTTNPMQLTPEEYERFCAVLLENHGWRTELTKKSGDYGADIIASNGNQRMVIQCKQWSKSVGIKAVQEAHSAGAYYNASIVAVVATTKYTPAAKDMARSIGVRLLSHNNLASGNFNG